MIMPYFGPTHECFLLLSTLSNASRNKLDEFYSEFKKLMLRYSKEILIYEENLDQLFLPTDLYRLSTIEIIQINLFISKSIWKSIMLLFYLIKLIAINKKN